MLWLLLSDSPEGLPAPIQWGNLGVKFELADLLRQTLAETILGPRTLSQAFLWVRGGGLPSCLGTIQRNFVGCRGLPSFLRI